MQLRVFDNYSLTIVRWSYCVCVCVCVCVCACVRAKSFAYLLQIKMSIYNNIIGLVSVEVGNEFVYSKPRQSGCTACC